jgi:4-hydroxybenzoate polyprenyltransferase
LSPERRCELAAKGGDSLGRPPVNRAETKAIFPVALSTRAALAAAAVTAAAGFAIAAALNGETLLVVAGFVVLQLAYSRVL